MAVTVPQRVVTSDNNNNRIIIYQVPKVKSSIDRYKAKKQYMYIKENETTHRANLLKLEVMFLHQNAGKGYF